MRRLLLLALLLSLVSVSFSQTQKGYAKTKGRIDKEGNLIPGEPLEEVVVQVRDRNMVLSDDRGNFSFPIIDESYYLENVKKNGYVLIDPEMLSKRYTYSKDNLVIAFEKRDQQIDERIEINNRIIVSQKALIDKLREEVKQLKAENKITEEEYCNRLEEIADIQQNNQKMVDELVEEYSKKDYDFESEYNRIMSAYKLNGEWHKADSLIKTKGNLEKRAADVIKLKEANAKLRDEISRKSKKLEKREASVKKEIEDLANDFYDKYEILKLQHKNDSAAYYLEQRVLLDTTNVEWHNTWGVFLFDYIAEYKKALGVFNKALIISNEQKGDTNDNSAAICFNIGTVYYESDDFEKAIEYTEKAISIYLSLYGDNNLGLAGCYNLLGRIYRAKNSFDASLYYHQKSLDIREDVLGYNSHEIADGYNDIGVLYQDLGDYDLALQYYEKSLKIYINDYGKESEKLSVNYYNIGLVYKTKGDFIKAMEYYNKALEISLLAYGECHPDVAYCYNSMGILYDDIAEYEKSYEYLNKAMDLFKSIYGESSTRVAAIYNNLASYYENNNDFKKALSYRNEALFMFINIYGEKHIDVAVCYANIGGTYNYMKDYEKAEEYFIKSLGIMQELLDENHDYIATMYNNLAVICNTQSKYTNALDYLNKSLSIDRTKFGEDNIHVSSDYFNMGYAYEHLNDYVQALYYYEKSLNIREKVLSSDHPKTQSALKAVNDMRDMIKNSQKK